MLPDLRILVDEYYKGNIRADDFAERLGILYQRQGNSFKNHFVTFMQFPHRCMYDTTSLIDTLASLGFDLEVKKAFDSDIQDIRHIELAERTEGAVIVEGKKH
ncbi:MAG: hypothetical protein M1470_15175 [Bacteroidetes bacterium]|nr:hypothetical protein [Bacteroidota bacterium]MCL5737685.1 hypothetical protein [Bacteroidota bacterium]